MLTKRATSLNVPVKINFTFTAEITKMQPKMIPIQLVPTSQQSSSSEEEEPVTQRIIPTEELPPLPPLEMPNFDFTEGLLQQTPKVQGTEEADLSGGLSANELNKPEA